MKACQALAQTPHLFLTQRGLDARKDLILFQPDVVVKQPAEPGQRRLEVPSQHHGGRQLLDAAPDVGMLGQHLQDGGLGVERDVARQGREQHFLFFAEMATPSSLPETQEVAGGATKQHPAAAERLLGRARDEKCLHQGVVVVLAERVQAGVALHRPRWYYFCFSVRT